MSNLFAISPLVFLIGLLSFNATPASTDLTKFSQEEIFTGIFFSDGPFAEKIPELSKYSKTDGDQAKAAEFQAKVLEKINNAHPQYLSSLQEAVYSRNHSRIQSSIYEGADLLNDIVWTINPEVNTDVRDQIISDLREKVDQNTSADELESIVDNYLEGLGADDPDVARLLCVAVLAVVVAVAVGVFLWVLYIVEASVERTPLANEQIINSIANI